MSNPQKDETPWRGDKFETCMDGIAMDAPPQELLNRIGGRGLQGWQMVGMVPVPKPGQDPKSEEVEMVWGVLFQRKLSELVRV